MSNFELLPHFAKTFSERSRREHDQGLRRRFRRRLPGGGQTRQGRRRAMGDTAVVALWREVQLHPPPRVQSQSAANGNGAAGVVHAASKSNHGQKNVQAEGGIEMSALLGLY